MISLGLFNRFKKEEMISELPPIKKPEDIEKERIGNELAHLKKELREKSESYESISNKLSSVKEEYDTVISKLMSAKREVKDKQNEFNSIKSEYDEVSLKISLAKTELEETKKQHEGIKGEFEKFQKAKLELDSVKSDIEKSKTEYNEIQSKIDQSKEMVANIIKLEKEHKEIQGKIESAKKELNFTESQIYAEGNRDSPKSIIEAASSMMASLNAQLRNAQKELDAVKKTLEEERKAHKLSE
jgi:chromosome segregation protein